MIVLRRVKCSKNLLYMIKKTCVDKISTDRTSDPSSLFYIACGNKHYDTAKKSHASTILMARQNSQKMFFADGHLQHYFQFNLSDELYRSSKHFAP